MKQEFPATPAYQVGQTARFLSHIGKIPVQGEIVKVINGTDNLPYYGIKVGKKTLYKQEKYVTIVQELIEVPEDFPASTFAFMESFAYVPEMLQEVA